MYFANFKNTFTEQKGALCSLEIKGSHTSVSATDNFKYATKRDGRMGNPRKAKLLDRSQIRLPILPSDDAGLQVVCLKVGHEIHLLLRKDTISIFMCSYSQYTVHPVEIDRER
jgi:hypothetical protein